MALILTIYLGRLHRSRQNLLHAILYVRVWAWHFPIPSHACNCLPMWKLNIWFLSAQQTVATFGRVAYHNRETRSHLLTTHPKVCNKQKYIIYDVNSYWSMKYTYIMLSVVWHHISWRHTLVFMCEKSLLLRFKQSCVFRSAFGYHD